MGSQAIVKFNVIETPLQYKSSTQNNPTIIDTSEVSSHFKPTHDNPQEQDTELGIFEAKKYFSETNETKDNAKTQQQSLHHGSSYLIPRLSTIDEYGGNFRPPRSFCTTPSSSFKASCNSQTGLVSNPPGSIQVSLNSDIKRNSVAKKWLFARKCCCSGDKSVQVNKVASEIEHDLYKGRNPQILSRSSSISNEIIEENRNKGQWTEGQYSQRVSASGRPLVDGLVGFSFPIKNPIMNPIRDSLEFLKSKSPNLTGDEDMGSDASSDLFEIESFSAPTTSYPVRNSSDNDPRKLKSAINGVGNVGYGWRSPEETDTPGVAATECFTPSKVSIDWSAATVEGFSVSAAMESQDVAVLRKRMEDGATGSGGNRSKVNRLMLMGCQERKPVAVKCVAVGPPAFPLHVGGRPPRVANKTASPRDSE